MITENLSTLKIYKLTKEQYQRILNNGEIDKNALYFTDEEDIVYVTAEQLNNAVAQKSQVQIITWGADD